MVRVKEKPLTTNALNRFIETLIEEVQKSNFTLETRTNILSDLGDQILPIDTPAEPHDVVGYVLTTEFRKLPETLSELKRRSDSASSGLYREPSVEAAEKTLRAIMTKAFRAAEKETNREAAAR